MTNKDDSSILPEARPKPVFGDITQHPERGRDLGINGEYRSSHSHWLLSPPVSAECGAR
jgi:hypothetical protein